MYYTLLMMCVTFSLQRRRWYFFICSQCDIFFYFLCTITKIFATSTLYVMYTFMDALLVLHQRSMVLIVAGWAFWWMICQRICRPIAYPPDASFAHVTRCFPSLPITIIRPPHDLTAKLQFVQISQIIASQNFLWSAWNNKMGTILKIYLYLLF